MADFWADLKRAQTTVNLFVGTIGSKSLVESGRDREIETRRRRVFVMFLINLILVLFMALELIGGIKLAGKNRTISPRAEILLALGRFSTAVFLLGLLIIR